jgi:hypothetical protein
VIKANTNMSENKAKSLAVEVRRVTGYDVEVRAEEAHFVVEVRRAVGDSYAGLYTLRDNQDWQWLSQRIARAT